MVRGVPVPLVVVMSCVGGPVLGEFFSFLFVRLSEFEVNDVFFCDRVTLGDAH